MNKLYKILAAIVATALIALAINSNSRNKNNDIPLIAIANYGPHSSLQETIAGIKDELTRLGYIENENIRYELSDVNFETSLIIQMIQKLKASKPKLLVAISTPIAQAAKNMIKDIPVVYADVTDPEEAGLYIDGAATNITGASDRQDLRLMMNFAKQLLPEATKIGVLYSIGESNDLSLLKMLKANAKTFNLEVVAIPIEHTRDVISRMRVFKNNVDFIYTGSSGAIQASLPAIVNTAESMKLPLFNFNDKDVISHNALASYGVTHTQVGTNAAKIIHRIFNGEKPGDIEPVYPSKSDHAGFISAKRAERIGLVIPKELTNVTIVK
jgi:putative tryptophan/tyrosine transport system substrate-binding protein